MRLIEHIKNYIPITVGILCILTCFILSIFSFVGMTPFEKKDDQLSIIFLLLFLFGFYPGMLLGHCISYLLNICVSDKDKDEIILTISEETRKIKKNIKNNNKKKNDKCIDF